MTREDISLLEQHGFVARTIVEEDLFWMFEYRSGDIELLISWSLAGQSMQTIVKHNGLDLCTVSSENLQESKVTDKGIWARFENQLTITTLHIVLHPQISIKWGTLHKD